MYRFVLGPIMRILGTPIYGCRFTPTCGHYSEEAFLVHGPLRGALLSAKRLLKCHPWSKADPVDLVPRSSGDPLYVSDLNTSQKVVLS